MNWFKDWLKDFPNQNASVFVALVLILVTGIIVAVKLALGQLFPDGYEAWLVFLGAIAGINVGGMIGKRATDIGYAQAKASIPVPVTTTTETKSVSTEKTVAGPLAPRDDGAVG